MLVVDSSFTGLTEGSSEMSSPMLKFYVGTAVETPVVMPGGATGTIAVDPGAASSIAAAPSLRTAMITFELPRDSCQICNRHVVIGSTGESSVRRDDATSVRRFCNSRSGTKGQTTWSRINHINTKMKRKT